MEFNNAWLKVSFLVSVITEILFALYCTLL